MEIYFGRRKVGNITSDREVTDPDTGLIQSIVGRIGYDGTVYKKTSNPRGPTTGILSWAIIGSSEPSGRASTKDSPRGNIAAAPYALSEVRVEPKGDVYINEKYVGYVTDMKSDDDRQQAAGAVFILQHRVKNRLTQP